MSENGEIYTAGKYFTLPPALTEWTNSTSASAKPYFDHLGQKNHFCLKWSNRVQIGPKWPKIVNNTYVDHLGPFWTLSDHFGLKNDCQNEGGPLANAFF